MNLLLQDDKMLRDHLVGISGVEHRIFDSILKRPWDFYKEKYIPKKAESDTRLLRVPRKPLRKIQAVIRRDVLSALPVHEAVHGYVRRKSAVTYAAKHVGSYYVYMADVIDFFGSIESAAFKRIARRLKIDTAVVNTLQRLCFIKDFETGRVFLPQGTATSPILSNAVMYDFDIAISALAKRYRLCYTRYVDNIALSTKRLLTQYDINMIECSILALASKHGLLLHGVYSGPRQDSLVMLGVRVLKDGLTVPDNIKERIIYLDMQLKEGEINGTLESLLNYVHYVESSGVA